MNQKLLASRINGEPIDFGTLACGYTQVDLDSRSGFYTARKRAQVQPVVCEASVYLKAAFAVSGGAYGSRRLRKAMASRGIPLVAAAWQSRFVQPDTTNHQL